jgi:hypothetical protein
MKSVIEHVDEFIDGFLNGNIVSMFQKGVIRPFMREETVANQLAQMKATLFNELIPQYMSGDTQKKEQLAQNMVHVIMKLRMFGLIENNPISLNELQFLRSENTRLKEDIKGLEEKVKQLSTALIAMPSEDAKVGVT